MANNGMPQLKADVAMLNGGMDVVVSPMFAKPGTVRLAYNYEWSVNGGLDRIYGIEPFDGRPSPSKAIYTYLLCTALVTGVAVGNTLVGATSAATGVVIFISGAFLAMTKVTGAFLVEVLKLSGSPVATVSSLTSPVDGFLDNQLNKAASDVYQQAIGQVPGSGPIRGLKILNDNVYAWRNDASGNHLAIYKATSSGWSAVPLLNQISFTAGTSAYAEGSTLSQGGVTATVRRVVLESGGWATSDAAGRLIIDTIAGGSFTAGAAAGGGACTLSGASSAITLAPDGRVRADVYTFTARLEDKRLYGCDGVNPEFEFDGAILVPLNTGMGSIRATAVACYANNLFFGYRGSLQNSGLGTPYIWSAIFGAAELGTGDIITQLKPIGGTQDASSMMVICRDALYILYGTSANTFQLVPLSRTSGGSPDAAQDIGGVVTLDKPGVVRYPATKNFGNFAWDTVSMAIQPLARNQACSCSVYVPGFFKYRLFFADGSAISGLPTKPSVISDAQGVGVSQFAWSVIDYGRQIVQAENYEINEVPRTFYGDINGWVYEADVGRSFAGDPIEYAIRMHPLMQQSPMVIKGYKQGQIEIQARSACTIRSSCDFDDGEGQTENTETPQYGPGGLWDITDYDQSFYDSDYVQRQSIPLEGQGTSISVMLGGLSDNELSHQIYAVTVLYIPRKIKR